jgi:RHS repeat-associated protein
LRTVRKNSVLQGSSVYDADGRRVRVWNPSDGWAVNVYSGLNVVCEVPSTGVGESSVHLYAGALHVASIKDGVSEYLHQDHLGSTRLRTDSAGNVVYEVGYQPYGVEVGESGSERFKYTGKSEDESTGLYYFGARFYDPGVGRFITEDTVLGSISDPQSLNRYVYCRNNPLKYVDPDGRLWNIAIGALSGGGLNLAFYFFELAVTGERFDANVALTKMVTGTCTGALAGATLGMSLLVSAPINTLGGIIVPVAVDNVINGPTLTDKRRQELESELTENLQDVALNEGPRLAYLVTEATAFDTLDSVIGSIPFGGSLITNTISLSRTIIDRWWEDYTPSQVTTTTNPIYYGQEPFT